ncbi:MAG: M28 family peptidase, partial [Gemmatimonadota bacterium]
VRNVVGTLQGTEHPDEWIVLGSHYDAWTFGAVDPNSGTAMLLALAEALGALVEDGCRPERSIKIAHWDVEEFGIIGSIEWVEQLRERLMEGAVAYLNADGAVSGASFGGSASPSLKGPIVEATRHVDHPDGGTVHATWADEDSDDGGPTMGNLGGGSDHVGFYMHAGVPSAGLSMSGSSPMYHSGYDDRAWYERFADTAFVYGPTLARVDGLLALRLARADLVPYDVQRYPEDLEAHLETLASRADEAGYELELSPVREAVDDLAAEAEAFVAARDRRLAAGDLPGEIAREVNRGLIGLEKAFLHGDGLQWNGWYRSLYASSDPFSGYASWMLPALRYEVETDGSGAGAWVDRYGAAVDDLTRRLGELTEVLRTR